MGPEQERLMDRLFNDPTRKLRNFKITPGDKPVTAEELCGEINRAMDDIESGRLQPTGPARSLKPPRDVRDLIAEDYCGQCGGPCLRRPRHGEAWA